METFKGILRQAMSDHDERIIEMHVGMTARNVRRILAQEAVALDVADRTLCALDMPHMLMELWPELYDFHEQLYTEDPYIFTDEEWMAA